MTARTVRVVSAASLLIFVWALAWQAGAEDPRALAERLARTEYFEGVPPAEAARLGPAGVERLVELFDDPDGAEHRARIALALGLSGEPAAYPALARRVREEPRGEVSTSEYRLRLALPFALGHLARSDDRAYRDLAREVGRPLASPGWRYRHLGGPRLASLLRRAAVSGLALSGRPAAGTLIEALQAQAASEPGSGETWRLHLEDCRRLREQAAAIPAGQLFAPGPR